MSDSSDLLRIGAFARLAGTSLRTLRYYEELDLIEPAHRSAGGFRYYRPADVQRVRLIQGLQELGLDLERIHDLVAGGREVADRAQWVRRVRAALGEVDRLVAERMRALEERRANVGEALAKLDLCRTCEHRPEADNNYCQPCQRTGEALPTLLAGLF